MKKKSSLSACSANAKNLRLRRTQETEEVRSARLAAVRERLAKRRALETPLERETRLMSNRKRLALGRFYRKMILQRAYKDSVKELSYKCMSNVSKRSRTSVTCSRKTEQKGPVGRPWKSKEPVHIKEDAPKIKIESCDQLEAVIENCSTDTPMAVNVLDNIKLEIEENL